MYCPRRHYTPQTLVKVCSDPSSPSNDPAAYNLGGKVMPINVGWGSKQTQFHGSLGKAAAQDTSVTQVGCSPDDDTLPRISWRGDGSLFAVSSLSSPDANNDCRRILRVYDRQAALQTTSEPVAGLEHTLAWRPSGNLIAGTQRFGFEGGGAGKESRHDLVFFEKNGLRHGQFGLRPDDLGVQKPPTVDSGEIGPSRWGYKVREVNWNSDSNVLSIWITRSEGDIGAFPSATGTIIVKPGVNRSFG
jgi:elongator complex protein 1